MAFGGISPDQTRYYTGLSDKSPGIASVGSYQASGHPYVSGTVPVAVPAGAEVAFRLPNVSKSITLMPLTNPADIFILHFAPASAGPTVVQDHGIQFPAWGAPAITINVKCVDVFITNPLPGPSAGGAKFYASLTGIASSQMFSLTGSGVTE